MTSTDYSHLTDADQRRGLQVQLHLWRSLHQRVFYLWTCPQCHMDNLAGATEPISICWCCNYGPSTGEQW